MSDTIPGGVDPTPPLHIVYRLITEDGRLLGAVWVAEHPQPGRMSGGAITHLGDMPHRLAWLGQYLRDAAGAPALAELAAMGGLRWQASSVDAVAADLDDLRHTLEAIAYERGEIELMDPPVAVVEEPSRADLLGQAAAQDDTDAQDDTGTTKRKRPSGAQQRKAKAARDAAVATQGGIK